MSQNISGWDGIIDLEEQKNEKPFGKHSYNRISSFMPMDSGTISVGGQLNQKLDEAGAAAAAAAAQTEDEPMKLK